MKNIAISILIIIILLIAYYLCAYKKEGFSVIIGVSITRDVKKINLRTFFKFIDKYMIHDIDEKHQMSYYDKCYAKGEKDMIRSDIKNILGVLSFMVKNDDYHDLLMKNPSSFLYSESMSIHNYYDLQNIIIHLPTLKNIIDDVEHGDISKFQSKFIDQMKSMMNSMIRVTNTWDYNEFVYQRSLDYSV